MSTRRARLLARICRKFDVVTRDLRIGPLQIPFTQIKNPDSVLDAIVDGHFETIQQMDDAIEDLEDRLFDESGSVRELQQITYRLRKELVQLPELKRA